MRIDVRGLSFTLEAGGPDDGPPVLLLHGFPQHSGEWDRVLPALHAAGLRTYALDQRGYSPGARPQSVADYQLAETVTDAVAVLDALSVQRAHIVGHDWGAAVGWLLAGWHPERVSTLTAVSVPHPAALRTALRAHLSQRLRMTYMKLLRRDLGERLLLARDGAGLRLVLAGLDRARQDRYVQPMRVPGALAAALRWYRALNLYHGDLPGPVTVPTTYVWSDRDGAVGPHAARACAAYVAADYRFVRLPGVNHWIPDLAPGALTDAVLSRISAAPNSGSVDATS